MITIVFAKLIWLTIDLFINIYAIVEDYGFGRIFPIL